MIGVNMTEQSKTNGADNSASNPDFVIHRLYLKDFSFESPMVPQVFQKEWKPKIDFNLNSKSQKVSEDTYEVVLYATLSAKIEDKTAYLAEAEYGGLFTIKNFPQEQLDPLLKSYCPTIIYPFLREVFFDAVNKGSFPQIHLAPINFDAVYASQLEQQKQEQPVAPAKQNEAIDS